MTTTPTPVDQIDVSDVVTVEPSPRAGFYDLTVWHEDGAEVVAHTGRRSEMERLRDLLHAALATYPPFAPGDVIVESPSGWSYRRSQENGDNVDCRECGDPLDDDFEIVNDGEGYAFHPACLEIARG